MNFIIAKGKTYLLLIPFLTIILHSCTDRIDRATIEGYLSGNPKTYIYINRFEGDSLALIDSVRTNSKGHFKIKLQSENPYFVAIGMDKIQTPIILLIQPDEALTIKAENSDLSDYSVFGSNGSTLLRDLNVRLKNTKLQIDSLHNVYSSNIGNPKIDSIKHLLDSTYNLILDRHHTYTYGFIKNNSFSPASIFALFQAYDSLHPVLDYSKDRKLFRMIDSTLMSVYSSNSIVKAYHLKIQRLDTLYERSHKRELMFKEGETLPNVGYPLISGDNLFVSGIWFKYILIDFWADWCDVCGDNNQHLRQIYKEYGPKGLVVLQVSLGANPDSLKMKVARDSLFWYHASIQDIYNSRLLDTLRISSVPSSYLTDRWGTIKGVNFDGERLGSKLKELLH